jgi:hypothetical protein
MAERRPGTAGTVATRVPGADTPTRYSSVGS